MAIRLIRKVCALDYPGGREPNIQPIESHPQSLSNQIWSHRTPCAGHDAIVDTGIFGIKETVDGQAWNAN